MADQIPPFKSRRGRPEIHPWELWADGTGRRLYRGQDFQARPLSMRTMAHRKATSMGMKVSTHIGENEDFIDILFYR